MKILERMRAKRNEFEETIIEGVSIAGQTVAGIDAERKTQITKKVLKGYNFALLGLTAMMMVGMAFAGNNNGGDPAKDVVMNMIGIICKVFRYVGVVLAVYSVGQLVMAFKNEDADSKSRATTMLVVACILIGVQALVDQINVEQYL